MTPTDPTSRHYDLACAVGWARSVMARVDGVLEQIAAGEWDDELDEASAETLRRRIAAMTEVVRLTRATAHGTTGDEYPVWPDESGLPLNRKERFWTGTVLPALLTTPYFLNLDIFTSLCGMSGIAVGPDAGPVEFYSEYNLRESLFTAEDRARFRDAPDVGDTPDLVIVGANSHGGQRWMLAVEAKMFHTPSVSALGKQLERQRVVLDYLRAALDIPPEFVGHTLLVPRGLPTGDLPIVTWEAVLEAYRGIAPTYWTSILERALDSYSELRSIDASGGPNAQGRMTGAEIVSQHADGSLTARYVGRQGGLSGKNFAADVGSGAWRTTRYQIRVDPLDDPRNPNWMTVADFIALTSSDGEQHPL